MADIILKTELLIKDLFKQETTGHDWWHINRVRNNALYIAKNEGADPLISELAALLHEVNDDKVNTTKDEGERKLRFILNEIKLGTVEKNKVLDIINCISFRGGNNPPLKELEAKVVQDADRLDAIGAIGIARAFTFCGSKGNVMYNPEEEYTEKSKEAYLRRDASAIDHFYDKLLKLKDLMNTETAKRMAKERHLRMETFLNDFYLEWNLISRIEDEAGKKIYKENSDLFIKSLDIVR